MAIIALHIHNIAAAEMPELESLIVQYPKGIGNLAGVEIKLHIDE